MRDGKLKTVFLATTVLLLLVAIPAMAQQKKADPMKVFQTFNIVAGPLEESLNAYSKATGVKTVYLNELVAGKNTQGLEGSYSTEGALKKILQRTGLTYQVTANNTVILKKDPKEAVESEKEQTKNSVRQSLRSIKLGDVKVTAEKREKDVQEIPGSVSVITEIQLEDSGINSTMDLSSLVPNLYFIKTGNALVTDFASIRGINGTMNANPALGLYVDNVYYSGLSLNLLDIKRVEVLRGPQSTLYGRNSEAGVINIITKEPSNFWTSSVNLGYSSFNSYEAQGALSGPLVSDKLAFRGALRYFETDSYFENRLNGDDDAGRMENLDGRFSLQAAALDNLDITLRYDLQRYKSPKYANYALLGSNDLRKNIVVDFPGESDKDSDGVSLQAEYRMDGINVMSITSYRKEDFNLNNDIDFTPFDLVRLDMSHGITSFSQEFRVVSDSSGSPVQWIGGLFFLSEESDGQVDIWMNYMNMGMGMPGETLSRKSVTDTLGVAAFGEFTYTFFNQLDVTLGIRYDREQKDFDFSRMPGGIVQTMMGYMPLSGSTDKSFDTWLPKAAVSYQFSDEMRSYVSVSRGFRSGGFNAVEKIGSSYEPEFTMNYELGVKTSWLDKRLQLNASLFYIDWSDMQVEVLTSGGATVYIDNAGKATSKGTEIELIARPIAGLEVIAGAAYTKAEYDDFSQGPFVHDGNRVVDSPEYTLNLGGTYRFTNGLFVSGRYAQFGEIFFDPANTQSQSSYGIVDAKIGYETKHFDMYLYSNNLFDEEYATRAFEVSNRWYGRSGEPRTFGIMLTGRF